MTKKQDKNHKWDFGKPSNDAPSNIWQPIPYFICWLKFIQGDGHILWLDYDICRLDIDCATVQVYGETTGRE